MPTEPVFSYATDPQPVKPRSKYRNVGEEVGLTLMSDPRVRRGPTLALTKKLQQQQQQFAAAAASPGKTRQQVLAATQGSSKDSGVSNQPTYSFTVPNFISSSFDVSRYLVAAEEDKRPEAHVTSQTDEFMPLPPPAEYVPRKTGVDASTQVEDARELFDFDAEVQPLVSVIVQKTLEQALFEVSSEDELASLETAINRFNVEREIAAGWILEKEEELMEEHAVKERERAAQLRVIRAEMEIRRRVACAEAVRQIMPDVVSSVFDDLKSSGVWREQDRDEARDVHLPAAYARAAKLCEYYGAASEIVDEILMAAERSHFSRGEVDHIARKRVRVHLRVAGKHLGEEQPDIDLASVLLAPETTYASFDQNIKSILAERSINVFTSWQKQLAAAFGVKNPAPDLQLLSLELPSNITVLI